MWTTEFISSHLGKEYTPSKVLINLVIRQFTCCRLRWSGAQWWSQPENLHVLLREMVLWVCNITEHSPGPLPYTFLENSNLTTIQWDGSVVLPPFYTRRHWDTEIKHNLSTVMKLINLEVGLSPQECGSRVQSQPLGCGTPAQQRQTSVWGRGSEITQPWRLVTYCHQDHPGRLGPSLHS